MSLSLTIRSRIEDLALTATVFGLSYGALTWIGIGEYSVLKVSGAITIIFLLLYLISKLQFTKGERFSSFLENKDQSLMKRESYFGLDLVSRFRRDED